ncbi:MAG: hypothetical protein K2Q20_07505 [Phycisphaerales bacterium]|nr:hypothetical protein [Phycisphaerales bacterium]
MSPASGRYTHALVVTDWQSVDPASSSRTAYPALHALPLGASPGSDFAPANSGPVHFKPTGRAFGSAVDSSARTAMFWYDRLITPFSATGSTPLYLSAKGAAERGRWTNTRVTLNPVLRDSRTFSGAALPTSFTDLGTLQTGNTDISTPVTVTTGLRGQQWVRFRVSSAVSDALGNTFDVFTTPGTATSLDSSMVLFRESGEGLIPVAAGSAVQGFTGAAGLSFGSATTGLFGRGYGIPGGQAFFAGQGGDITFSALHFEPPGWVGNRPGEATLSPAQTYWLAISNDAAAITTNPDPVTVFLGADASSVDWAGSLTYDLANPTRGVNTTLFIKSVPGVGGWTVLALGAAVTVRRRRRPQPV